MPPGNKLQDLSNHVLEVTFRVGSWNNCSGKRIVLSTTCDSYGSALAIITALVIIHQFAFVLWAVPSLHCIDLSPRGKRGRTARIRVLVPCLFAHQRRKYHEKQSETLNE